MRSLFSSCFLIFFSFSLSYSQVSAPKFSLEGGFYESPLLIYLTSEDSSAVIYYTTDGSDPADSSIRYTSPVPIGKTAVLKARAFLSDSVYSSVKTNTYFINESTILPVFSISTDPKNLWDPKTGIYVYPNYKQEDWERPVHLEFYEADRSLGFTMDAGMKINGETSRDFPQKSLAILARQKYGYGKIHYKMFQHLPVDEFEVLVLRNSGTDWNNTMFRDGLDHHLLRNTDVDVLAYRPSVVFLNGEYFGIHNVREKPDEHYITSHHGVNPDSLYIVRYWGMQPERGGDVARTALYSFEDFAAKTDFTIKKNYDSLKTVMDIDEFIGYVVAQVFYDNTDWPANNVKCWKEINPSGKWRWILWDTDYGFDFLNKASYKNMSLDFITGIPTPIFGTPPIVTSMMLNFFKNEEFKNRFINCFSDFTNTFLRKDSLLKTINEIKKAIEPEIPRHFTRWNDTASKWINNVAILEKFAENRQYYIQQNFMNKFKLSGLAKINIDVVNSGTGNIKLNSIYIAGFPWRGNYFTGVPITIMAKAMPGYKFKEWQGISDSKSNPLPIALSSDISIKAVFEPDSGFTNVVINEINYNSSPGFDTEDWVELFNASDDDQDISGWTFKDENDQHLFRIPEHTMLKKNEYLVLCRDTLRFSSLFPEVKNRSGSFGFGLNNTGELIRLFDKNNNIIDSLTFDDSYPWPIEADGSGKTLELKNPRLDNSVPLNWAASQAHGSPGKQNSQYTSVKPEYSKLPEDFILFQNYPNPFNPETTIKYALPVESRVKIAVINTLGRSVRELISAKQAAGYHVTSFHADNLASGVYFYIFEAQPEDGSGYFRHARKMLLLK